MRKSAKKSMRKSEAMIGNTRAKRGVHESLVMRLPVVVVDGLHACLEAEDFPGEANKRDVLEYAIRVLIKHIETTTGKVVPWPAYMEDEEALALLAPQEQRKS